MELLEEKVTHQTAATGKQGGASVIFFTKYSQQTLHSRRRYSISCYIGQCYYGIRILMFMLVFVALNILGTEMIFEEWVQI